MAQFLILENIPIVILKQMLGACIDKTRGLVVIKQQSDSDRYKEGKKVKREENAQKSSIMPHISDPVSG